MLEIIWRQAAILVLVATIPITAAGLLAHTTASWFWRGLRWTLAAIAVKPVLALIVVIGLSSLANAFLWNMLLVELFDLAAAEGIELPLWRSSNTVGGDEANAANLEHYGQRVPGLL